MIMDAGCGYNCPEVITLSAFSYELRLSSIIPYNSPLYLNTGTQPMPLPVMPTALSLLQDPTHPFLSQEPVSDLTHFNLSGDFPL